MDEEKYNIKLHNIDFVRNPLNLQNIKAYRQLVELMKTEKFDMVHCNTPVGGLLGRLAAKKCGIKKVIYQVHGFHFYKGAPKKNWLIYYHIEKMLAHITDTIITINQEDYEAAKKFKLRNNGNVYYVPGVGIDTDSYKNVQVNKEELRKSLGLKSTDIVCISAGRLDVNKNNSAIIKAIGKVNNEKIHLLICGNGSERNNLETLVKNLKIESQIHFLDNRSDMIELYKIADIFVLCSFREGLSRAIMEAMASGLPCIVSKIRGNVDLIENGKGGYLADPHNSDEFAEKLNLLLDENLREKMSLYNLEKIKDFDIEVVTKEIENIYKEVLM